MKGLNGLPLDDDIVDRILMFSPDFATLKNMILTAKAFHAIFQIHPKSVLRAVAYNVVGPALPQALRLVRYQIDEPDAPATEDPTDPEGAETGEYAPIKPEETRHLLAKLKVVKGLEKLYSLRRKNHKFKESQLSFMESLRFQRAIYRIMLYCRIFNGHNYLEEFETALNDGDTVDDMPDKLAKARRDRKKFLDTFSDEHLIQIHSVARFLTETAMVIRHRQTTNLPTDIFFADIALSAGPECIYESFEQSSPFGGSSLSGYVQDWDSAQSDNDDDEPYPLISGYISYPLEKLYGERKMKPPSGDLLHWKAILDSIEGDNETCSRCDDKDTKGSSLWGPSTYEFLSKIIYQLRPYEMITYLKGHLRYNPVEGPYFKSLMDKMPPDQNIHEYIVQDILDDDYKQPEFEDWKKEDWLCISCLKKLLSENLHLWLLNKRIQGEAEPTAIPSIHSNAFFVIAGDNVPSEDCCIAPNFEGNPNEPAIDWTEANEHAPIEPEEIPELVEIATTAKGLGDFFSLRHKNHKFTESQLTFEESLRFQRAMYRIMLYSRIFGGYQYLEDYQGDSYGDQWYYAETDLERQKRRRFPDTLSGDHLVQIHSVSEFLIETALIFEPRHSTNGSHLFQRQFGSGSHRFNVALGLADHTDNSGQMMLSAGPDIIYQCH
ncbi:hypothetical protein PQX77_007084 [Marasmius sp. AFHP31]|nr:hypothetical protein PQX77_007084 [Marasmius sp. AFHP31]